MASDKRRNLEETLKIIVNFNSGSMKPTQFSQAIGCRGSAGSSTFNKKNADLKFYGLVEHLSNGDYKFTEVCGNLKEDKPPRVVRESKIKAFLYPEDFRKIYRAYQGDLQFNDKVIEEIADLIDQPTAIAKKVIDVFLASGKFAEVIEEKPNNFVTIRNVDDIAGISADQSTVIEDKIKEVTPPRSERRTDEKKLPETDRIDHRQVSGITLGVNFNLDGTSTPEMVNGIFDFLREAGIGDKKHHHLELLVTEPPLKKELLSAIERLILETEKEIIIVAPWLDSQVLDILIPRAKEGVKVMVITRTLQQTKGNEAKDAWTHLAEEPNINHQCCDQLHSRMILQDKSTILISSADINHDSLEGQFNAGILSDNPTIVKQGEAFIKGLLTKSKKSNTS